MKISTIFFAAALTATIASCTNHQEMMEGHGNNMMYTTSWNWLLVVLGLVIVFLLGIAIARRKR